MARSYLKWVGGKTQLAEELIRRFPEEFTRYAEMFCGSAALFFAYYGRQSQQDIFSKGDLPPAILNDYNDVLINCHEMVAGALSIHQLKALMDELEKEHEANPEATYKKYREHVASLNGDPYLNAAQFIYINKTCFNGLWRVNGGGKNNVPFNGKTKVKLYDRRLEKCSKLLRKYATLCQGDFRDFSLKLYKGDFAFIDPPYVPMSATSSFTGYTTKGWSEKDDSDLALTLDRINEYGVKFMMTNSNAPKVYELFGKWNIVEVKAHRFVKALTDNEDTREKVNETIITNY